MKSCVLTVRWLWAVWMAYRVFWRPSFLFTQRQVFLIELRPIRGGARLAWPDAFFLISPEDVRRATRAVEEKKGMA